MAVRVALSARMQAVADMVTSGNRVADVGCDHGYVSIYLVQQGRSEHVIAMDINKGPLERAGRHVKEAGLLSYISLRLSDGLANLKAGEADTLICAGMGGRLMWRILSREPKKTASFQELVLQPQSEIAEFRFFLTDAGYQIVSEDMIREEGKFYPVIRAVKGGGGKLSGEEARFGPVLLETKHPILKKYLEEQWGKLCGLEKELALAGEGKRLEQRRTEIQNEKNYVKKAAERMGISV